MILDPTVLQVREAMPVTQTCTYLNTGSIGPVSTVFAACRQQCLEQDLRTGRATDERYARIEESKERLRGELAHLLEVGSENIALMQNTSAGLRTVIDRFPWERGDEAILTSVEHPACRVPFEQAARRLGIVLRVAKLPSEPTESLSWLTSLLTPRTRLVAFSGAAFTTGASLPIARVTEIARERGVVTLLDAAQCAGVVPLPLAELGIDFCALPLQKWLCGPEGLGALYARPGLAESLGKGSSGEACDLQAAASGNPVGVVSRVDARALDAAVNAWGAYEAAAAQLRWMRTEIGWPWIFAQSARLADYARRGLAAVSGISMLTPVSHASLIAFSVDSREAKDLLDRLRARRFVFRFIAELNAIRISTAYLNTEAEIDEFIGVIS